MLLPLLLLGAAGLWSVWCILSALWSPHRSIPGPFWSRFTDGWYFWRVSKGKFHFEQVELHRRYGSIVRLGPNRFSFADPGALKTIYGHGNEFRKSDWYTAFNVPAPLSKEKWNVFTETDIKLHAQQRRPYTNIYSMTSLISYEPYVDDCADLFIQRLEEFSNARKAPDMGHWFQCLAFDVIGMITSGERYGFLDRGDDVEGIMAAIEKGLKFSVLIGTYPRLYPYFYKLQELLPKHVRSAIDRVFDFTQAKIDKLAKSSDLGSGEKEARQSFISKMLQQHQNSPEEFTKYHIFTAATGNIGAGSDTTSIAFSSILYHLIKYPRCMTALRDEIDNAQSAGLLSPRPTFKESQEMPYFRAVIKEAMRVHPSIALPYERIVPAGGATICGQFFPAGANVGCNPYVEHRIKSVWGDDAEEFRPERWLTSDQNQLSLMNRHWIPFGTGSRTCLGKNVSLLEIQKVILRIVRDFNFEPEEGSDKDWKTENAWFVKPKGWKVKVSVRSKRPVV